MRLALRGWSHRQIERRVDVSYGTVSRRLRILEDQGLIERDSRLGKFRRVVGKAAVEEM
jgi:DNA-binding MarR family transcriptional regulator